MLGTVYYKGIAGLVSMQSMVYDLIRRKTFDDDRYQKKWLLIVDGSQLYSGSRQINEQCLKKYCNKGTEFQRLSSIKITDRNAEKLAGRYHTCMQLECPGDEKSLHDAADIRYNQAAV